MTAGGTAGEGVVATSALSCVGLAYSTGWIAGDNASTDKPSYVPSGMEIEPEIRAQRLLNKLNKHFPNVGAFLLKTGYSLSKLTKK